MKIVQLFVRILLTPFALAGLIGLPIMLSVTILPMFTLFDLATSGKTEMRALFKEFWEASSEPILTIWGFKKS